MTFRSVYYTLMTIACFVSIYLSFENYFFYEEKVVHDSSNHDESVHIIEQANSDTTDSMLQLQAARVMQNKNQFEDALVFYKRYENIEKIDADVSAEIGLLLWSMKPNVESVKYFSKSLSMDSLHPGGLIGMGIATAVIGEREKALVYFDKILRHHANSELAIVAKKWKLDINKN